MLPAGKLREFVTIQRASKAVTGTRGTATAWTEIATTRAEVVKASASEFLTGFGSAERGTVIFRIRWRDDVKIGDCILFEGRAHDIKEISKIGQRIGLEIRATALS